MTDSQDTAPLSRPPTEETRQAVAATNMQWVGADDFFRAGMATLLPSCVLLDIGPGIRPQNYIIPLVHICCEPFQQYVERLRAIAARATDRMFVIQAMTWQQVVENFSADSVDTVILSDVIEHLDKDEGRRLLERTKTIARQQIAIFTPLGFIPQHHEDGIDAWGLEGGAWQEHKSGWLPEDFGEDWRIIASNDFHRIEDAATGKVNTYGALWAVYTKPCSGVDELQIDQMRLWQSAAEVAHSTTVRLATRFIRFANWIKPHLWKFVRHFMAAKAVVRPASEP